MMFTEFAISSWHFYSYKVKELVRRDIKLQLC
jgi:hypothetical protein